MTQSLKSEPKVTVPQGTVTGLQFAHLVSAPWAAATLPGPVLTLPGTGT